MRPTSVSSPWAINAAQARSGFSPRSGTWCELPHPTLPPNAAWPPTSTVLLQSFSPSAPICLRRLPRSRHALRSCWHLLHLSRRPSRGGSAAAARGSGPASDLPSLALGPDHWWSLSSSALVAIVASPGGRSPVAESLPASSSPGSPRGLSWCCAVPSLSFRKLEPSADGGRAILRLPLLDGAGGRGNPLSLSARPHPRCCGSPSRARANGSRRLADLAARNEGPRRMTVRSPDAARRTRHHARFRSSRHRDHAVARPGR